MGAYDGFTIPNDGSGLDSDQSELDRFDVETMLAVHQGYAVISGCEVTEKGTPDMSVDVADGRVIVDDDELDVTGVNKAVSAADATNPRFDLVTVDGSGTVTVTAGTAAANPAFPTPPSSETLLAAIYVPANETAIETANIIDKRVLLRARPLHRRRTDDATNDTYLPHPGFIFGASVSNYNVATDNVRFYPFYTERAIVLDEVAVQVTTSAAGANARLGIYDVGEDLVPTDLITDFGEIDCSSTGIKTITGLAEALEPGDYALALLSESGTVQYVANSDARAAHIDPTNFAQRSTAMTRARSYASGFEDPIGGAVTVTYGTTNSGFRCPIHCRWSEP